MRGRHRVQVRNKFIKYDFEIKRNITIIRGDSATGKTTLVEMIGAYERDQENSGVEVSCDKNCVVLSGTRWKNDLNVIKDSIVFIDEESRFTLSEDFAVEIKKTDNYYVIIMRESINNLPYSVQEIYGIRMSGKYAGLREVYNELYQLYPVEHVQDVIRPDIVITEDSNAGFQFFEYLCRCSRIRCFSAGGKSKLVKKIMQADQKNKVLVIADGAAIGSEMEKLTELIKENDDIILYLPESFEWLILKSGFVDGKQILEILEHTEDFIESSKYFSWERFFTEKLVEQTEGTYLQYTKKVLNPVYLQNNFVDAIRKKMEYIDLSEG